MTKMLFIQSEDYWGYDASSFDDAINFYKFAWTVPSAQYSKMDEEDQNRLYPCALFYVAGVTDNHNFLTLKIVQDKTEAKVSGMEGTKRRTRRYEVGSNAQYSVGSYALQAAPASATTISEIKEAVESGSTSEGSFLISGFLDDAASVADAVNYEEKSAESFAAPVTEPSGSAYEPADPTVANPSTEGPSESELITMSAEIEYAELGDESYPIVPNTTGQDSSFNGHGVPQWYGAEGEGDISHDRIDEETERPVILRHDHASTFYEWNVDGPVTDDQEYEIEQQIENEVGDSPDRGQNDYEFELYEDDRTVSVETDTHYGEGRFYGMAAEESFDAEGGRLRDIRGKFMNRGKAKNAVFGEVMSQQMGGYYRTGIVGDNPPVGQDISRRNPVAKAKYFVQPGVQNDNTGAWSKGPNFQQARKIAKGVAWDTVQDMGLAAESFNADGMSENDDGLIVCKYCDSTEMVQGDYTYCSKCDQTNFITQENLNAEDEYYQCDKCATAFEDEDAADYCCSACYACGYADHVGFERAQKCCACDCDETGGGPDGTCQEMFGAESFCAECGTTKKYRGEEEGCGCGSKSAEMEYAELGEELYPVVPNSEGGNTALDSGYGVPQWYGSAENDEQAPDENYMIIETDSHGVLRAIAPKANKYFDFYANEWQDASWANLPAFDTDAAYDACYFDFAKGGVLDGAENMIVSLDDFAEAIYNYDIQNIEGDYDWTDGYAEITSRRKITDTLEEASPAKGVLVAPAIAAVVGILGGIFYARRS